MISARAPGARCVASRALRRSSSCIRSASCWKEPSSETATSSSDTGSTTAPGSARRNSSSSSSRSADERRTRTQAEQLGRCQLVLGLAVHSCEGQHRLLEQLERELAVATGAAPNAKRAAVGLKVGSHPDAVIAIAAGLNLPAEQAKPQVENLPVHPCGCRHRRPFPCRSGGKKRRLPSAPRSR